MLNIIYLLQDAAIASGSSTAIATITSIRYDSSINGMVISCADGSTLVKKATVEYYAEHLKEFIEHAADEGIVFVAVLSLGVFMRVPADNEAYLYVHGHKAEYQSTSSAWDSSEPNPKGSRSQVSRMNLHGM